MPCGPASPQRNRQDIGVSDRSRSWVSGGQSCLPTRGLEPIPVGPVIVRNEWTAGWGANEGGTVGPANQWEDRGGMF